MKRVDIKVNIACCILATAGMVWSEIFINNDFYTGIFIGIVVYNMSRTYQKMS